MKRSDRFWLVAPVALGAVMLSALAWAATSDADKRDLEQNRKHHAALAEKDQDIAALTKALSRARADAEMCRDMAEPKKAAPAPDLGGSRAPLDR